MLAFARSTFILIIVFAIILPLKEVNIIISKFVPKSYTETPYVPTAVRDVFMKNEYCILCGLS